MLSDANRWSRRRVLGATLGLSGAALASTVLRPGTLAAAQCLLTPAQGEGPFYPPQFGTPGNDLIAPGPDGSLPKGTLISLVGRITDAQCGPVGGAVVEIWQADADGRYAHPSGAAPSERDARFRYFGRTVTDASGAYAFRTILPSAYQVWSFWRTPHVHFKVRRPGANVLTSQLYFEGHELNARDSLFRRLSEAERRAATARPAAPLAGVTPWRFDIALA